LVVIGIIAVLVTLVTYGIKSVVGGQREKSTRVTMENLKNLIIEKQVTGGVDQLDQVYPATTTGTPPVSIRVLDAPLKFSRDFGAQAERFPVWGGTGPQNATALTQAVMALLRAVPNNASWLAGLPSNQVWMPKIPEEVPTGSPRIPLVLDAWGNPIIYVPPGGLAGVTVSGNVKSRIADTNANVTISPQATVQSRDLKGFWASAGPDGFFTDPDPTKTLDEREPFGDDNVYSFDQ
jgi:type II secretory pathway pseudopilin PulG